MTLGNAGVLCRVVHGSSGIEDVDGVELPFTEDNLVEIAKVPYFAASAIDAYFDRFHLRKNL